METQVLIVPKKCPGGHEYFIVRKSDWAYLDYMGEFGPYNGTMSRGFPMRDIAVRKAESLGFEIVE